MVHKTGETSNSTSEARLLLRQIGIETSNLYTGFLAAAIKMLEPDAELVAITPRSFCNGPYFRGFRNTFLKEMKISRLHLFDSRQEAFGDNAVLQETVIVHALKSTGKRGRVLVTTSADAEDEYMLSREMAYDAIVYPSDPERFIRLVPDDIGCQIADRMDIFSSSLSDLGLAVSTGRVVNFRAKEHLRSAPEKNSAPLIWPGNLTDGGITWPKELKNPQAIAILPETETLLVPNEHYVLVKRFSTKEEKKRVVSAVFQGGRFSGSRVGFENHLNYYHQNGSGLNLILATGLSLFLNSTLVDSFFRQFNGHTQVNANDLRSLKYPSLPQLLSLGVRYEGGTVSQEQIDAWMQEEFFDIIENQAGNPIIAKKKIAEALEILVSLGLPRAQINERSALTLLALLNLKPANDWKQSQNPLLGITPIMEFMEQEYGKRYAPNTRETVRRQTMHQFLDAGLVAANPDQPDRSINSGKFVYQLESSALELFRSYGAVEWAQNLGAYLASVETLKKKYAQERAMVRIPIEVAPGLTITLSPGGQNVLVEQIIKEFAPRYTPGGRLLYVGDTDEKFAYLDGPALAALNIQLEKHGKMPDVIIHFTAKNWLILVEAVTSHGPINLKRKRDLQTLFGSSTAGLVLVTAFLSRKAMVQYLSEISWQTEVWIAEAPEHLIHFNGERFLAKSAEASLIYQRDG